MNLTEKFAKLRYLKLLFEDLINCYGEKNLDIDFFYYVFY